MITGQRRRFRDMRVMAVGQRGGSWTARIETARILTTLKSVGGDTVFRKHCSPPRPGDAQWAKSGVGWALKRSGKPRKWQRESVTYWSLQLKRDDWATYGHVLLPRFNPLESLVLQRLFMSQGYAKDEFKDELDSSIVLKQEASHRFSFPPCIAPILRSSFTSMVVVEVIIALPQSMRQSSTR